MSKCKTCGEEVIFESTLKWKGPDLKQEYKVLESNGLDKHYCKVTEPKFKVNEAVEVTYKNNKYLYRIEAIHNNNKTYKVSKIKFGENKWAGRVFFNERFAPMGIQYVDKYGELVNLDNFKLLYL